MSGTAGLATAGREAAGREAPAPVRLGERIRREAIGLALLVAVGLVFLVLLALYPWAQDHRSPIPPAILLIGWPLFLVSAGVLGYRLDRARGSFVAGLVAAVVAMVGTAVATTMAGQPFLEVGEGEWIGEDYLLAGLMVVVGGFLGLVGGGIAALVRDGAHRPAHS